MITATLPPRPSDDFGSGEYGASRGRGRTHKGEDYACAPGTLIHTRVAGKVTKIGYPYADDLRYRYVEVTSADGLAHRLFYTAPLSHVTVGTAVSAGDVVGTAQDIASRYTTSTRHMNNHIHYEIVRYEGGRKAEYFPPGDICHAPT